VASVQVSGKLDFATVAQLEEALRHAVRRAWLVVLDLTAVTSVDVASVHVIAYASMRARRAKRRLAVVHGPPHVDRVFACTRASDLVEFVDIDPDLSNLAALPRYDGEDFAS
jgi:anti-anti-sigma factor